MDYQKQATDFLEKTNTTLKAKFLKFDYHFANDENKRNIFKITIKNSIGSFSFNFGSSINDSCKKIKRAKIYSGEAVTIFYGFKHVGSGATFAHYIETNYPTLLEISNGLKTVDSIINLDEIQKDYDKYSTGMAAYKAKNKHSFVNVTPFESAVARIRAKILAAIEQARTDTDTLTDTQADNINYPTAYDVLACLQKYDVGTFENFCSEFGYDEDSRTAEKIYKAVCKEYLNVCKLWSDSEIEELAEIQ